MKASHLSMCNMTVRQGSLAEHGLVFRSILHQINELEYTSETQEGLFSWVHTKMGFSSDSMCWHIAKALRLQILLRTTETHSLTGKYSPKHPKAVIGS